MKNYTALIARHGTTAQNNMRKERMRGHSKIGLDEQGRDEARKLGRALKGRGVVKIFYSPLKRTTETAKIVSEILGGVPAVAEPDLETWDPGALTGKLVKDVKPAVDWYEAHPKIAPPGGEAVGTMHERIMRMYDKILKDLPKGGGVYLYITHTRVILTLQAISDNGSPKDMPKYWSKAPTPGSLMEISGKGNMKQVLGGQQKEVTRT